jgi:hypothetical protein
VAAAVDAAYGAAVGLALGVVGIAVGGLVALGAAVAVALGWAVAVGVAVAIVVAVAIAVGDAVGGTGVALAGGGEGVAASIARTAVGRAGAATGVVAAAVPQAAVISPPSRTRASMEKEGLVAGLLGWGASLPETGVSLFSGASVFPFYCCLLWLCPGSVCPSLSTDAPVRCRRSASSPGRDPSSTGIRGRRS